MKRLAYAKNYNNKLNCRYYTTIRPQSRGVVPGERVKALLDDEVVHEAIAVEIRHLTWDKINNFTACMDAGVELHVFKGLWKDFYPDFDFQKDTVYIILFRVVLGSARTDVGSSQSPADARTDTPTNEKIALFCRFFEAHTKVKYKISKAETGMIKRVEVTEDLLTRYFACTDWWASKKDVTNYCKNINQIQVLAKTLGVSASKNGPELHPNSWNEQHAKKLDGPGLVSYYAHLRNQGLVAKKNRMGVVVDWVPSDSPPAGRAGLGLTSSGDK